MSEITRVFRQCDTPSCKNVEGVGGYPMGRCCACDRDVCWSHQRKVISIVLEMESAARQDWPHAEPSTQTSHIVLCPACIPEQQPAFTTVMQTLDKTLTAACVSAVREALVIARIGLPAPEKETA